MNEQGEGGAVTDKTDETIIKTVEDPPALGERFDQALVYAARLHRGQRRKGSDIPYVSHLLSVAALVLEAGGDEDQAIAGLLHDAVEDQGGLTTLAEIRGRFGDDVAETVLACSDSWTAPKPPWGVRKVQYLLHLARQPMRVLLVSAADKLHNARAILADYRHLGDAFFTRFSGGLLGALWYYRRLVDTYRAIGFANPIVEELERTVAALEAVSDLPASFLRDWQPWGQRHEIGEITPWGARLTPFDTDDVTEARATQARLPCTDRLEGPDRETLRQSIAAELYGRGAAHQDRQAVIVIGVPGAGKSSALVAAIERDRGALVIDPDRAAARLPEYRDAVVHYPAPVYREACAIVSGVLARAVAAGDDLVIEMVGMSVDRLEAIRVGLQAHGYQVYLNLVELPAVAATERLLKRFYETGVFVDPINLFLDADLWPADLGPAPNEVFEEQVIRLLTSDDG